MLWVSGRQKDRGRVVGEHPQGVGFHDLAFAVACFGLRVCRDKPPHIQGS